MTVSPNDLKYFLEIASTQNLTRASEKLNISQPSLSMAIKRLEKSIGALLIIRHKRGVSLSKAGKLLLSHAKELIQNWDIVKSGVEVAYHNPEGQVTLGCHLSVGLHTIPGFLPSLLQKYPKLELRMSHGFSYNLIDNISKFEIDIGILVNPMKQPDLVIRKLYEDYDTFWYAPNKKSLDLKNPTILCDLDRSQTQILLKKFKKITTSNSRIITSSSLEMLSTLTASGCGIGILPARVVSSTNPGKLKQIPSAPTCHDEICLVYRHENKSVGAIKVVVEAINDFFKNEKS
jgi:LysR family transcriptional regulator, cell division regulator